MLAEERNVGVIAFETQKETPKGPIRLRSGRLPETAATTLDYLATQAGRLVEPRVYEALRVVIVRGDVAGIPRVG